MNISWNNGASETSTLRLVHPGTMGWVKLLLPAISEVYFGHKSRGLHNFLLSLSLSLSLRIFHSPVFLVNSSNLRTRHYLLLEAPCFLRYDIVVSRLKAVLHQLSLIKATSWFKMHGPIIRSSNKISKGPIMVEIRVVSQGVLLNHPLNHPWLASLSLCLLSSRSLSFFIESSITPEWSL